MATDITVTEAYIIPDYFGEIAGGSYAFKTVINESEGGASMAWLGNTLNAIGTYGGPSTVVAQSELLFEDSTLYSAVDEEVDLGSASKRFGNIYAYELLADYVLLNEQLRFEDTDTYIGKDSAGNMIFEDSAGGPYELSELAAGGLGDLWIENSAGDELTPLAGGVVDVAITATSKLIFDQGTGDTYLTESSGIALDVYTDGGITWRFAAPAGTHVSYADILPNASGLWLGDTGGTAWEGIAAEQFAFGVGTGISITYDSAGNMVFADDVVSGIYTLSDLVAAGSAFVDVSGTPSNGESAVFTDANTIEGRSEISYDTPSAGWITINTSGTRFVGQSGTGTRIATVDADGDLGNGNLSGQVTTNNSLVTALSYTAISDQTELASGLVSTDELLLNDSNVLKRMDISVLETYLEANLNFPTGSGIVDQIAYWSTTSNISSGELGGDMTSSGLTVTAAAALITGKTELASGLASTDELLVSDAGTLKRMDISVIEDYMQTNLSFGGGGDVSNGDQSLTLGDGTASDSYIVFNQDTDRDYILGWDESTDYFKLYQDSAFGTTDAYSVFAWHPTYYTFILGREDTTRNVKLHVYENESADIAYFENVDLSGDGITVSTLANSSSEHILELISNSVTRLNVRADGSILMPSLGSDDTEDHVVAIDDSTGLLTKRSVSSIAGSGYIDGSGTAPQLAYFSDSNTVTSGNLTGHVTSTGTSTVLAVAAITGQTALTSGLASTDELLVSDGGVIKRMDVSVIESYMQSNLSFGSIDGSGTAPQLAYFSDSDTITSGNLTGHVTSTGTSTVLAVAAITGQTALTSGLASTDELLVNDGGVIKRMDVSVIEAYMQSNLSFGTGTIDGSGTAPQLAYFTDSNTVTSGNLTGDVTSVGTSTTIASNAVESGMINNNCISGKTALTSGLASTDELWVSDAGTIKRMDVSVLQDFIESNFTLQAGMTVPVAIKTSSYNLTTSDYAIGMAGTYSATLPATPGTGRVYVIWNTSSGTPVTVSNAGSDTFYYDGGSGATFTLNGYESAMFIFDGTNWRVITKYA